MLNLSTTHRVEAPSFSRDTYPVIETTLTGELNNQLVRGSGSGILTEEAG